MLQRYHVDEHKTEKAPNQINSQLIYLEAYRYSLDLCENPEIARQVALRFLASLEQNVPASAMLGVAKA